MGQFIKICLTICVALLFIMETPYTSTKHIVEESVEAQTWDPMKNQIFYSKNLQIFPQRGLKINKLIGEKNDLFSF